MAALNLKQLKAFREVINTGSVSEAARRLHRSQPAISATLASLERELGMALFLRQGMRLTPVPEAYYLLKESEEILRRVEGAERIMNDVKNSSRGDLEVASMPGPSVVVVPHLIGQFALEHAGARFSLVSKSSVEVEQTVSAQNSDLGLADYDLLDDPESTLVHHEIFDFDCYCAMRADDPLSSRELIKPQDLANRPMATLYQNHPTCEQTRRAFEGEGVDLNTRFQAQYFIALFAYISEGLACSIIDRLSIKSYFLLNPDAGRKLVFRPFRPRVNLRISLITPAYRPVSIVANSFTRHCSEYLQSLLTSNPQEY